MKKQRRRNESDEVAHVLDILSNPTAQGAGDIVPVFDHHYGEDGNVKKAKKVTEDDDAVCVIVDNELYCVDKDELD